MIHEWKLGLPKKKTMGDILTCKTDVEEYRYPYILIVPIEDEEADPSDSEGMLLFEMSTPMTLDVKHPVRKAEKIIVTTTIDLTRDAAIALAKTLLAAAEQRADK